MSSRAEELFERLQQLEMQSLEDLLADSTPEQLFMDYKQSGNGGSGAKLHDNDNRNFSKAVSGFGNSEGGILIWGVADDLSPIGLSDAAGFRKSLEAATSRVTVPPHPAVVHHHWTTDGQRGFAVSLIPKATFGPIRAVAKGLDNYYIRAGESHVIVPHDALAGLFGRKPQAVVQVRFVPYPFRTEAPPSQTVTASLGLALFNGGELLVDKAYLTAHAIELQSGVQFLVQADEPSLSRCTTSMANNFQVVSKEGINLAPGGLQLFCSAILVFTGPVLTPLRITFVAGASNARPIRFELYASVDELVAAIALLRQGQAPMTDVVLHGEEASRVMLR